jgi:predicted dehydrogenase
MSEKKRPLKMGILGCGSFAERRILPILRELDTIQVISLQKRNLEEAKKVASTWHVPNAVSTREELLSNPEIDAIFITTPNEMHEEDAIACARAGKHVLCEKPLAPTVAAILNMQAAFKTTTLSVGQSIRFKGCVQQAKSLLESGALGELLSFKAHFSIPVPQTNWRHRKEMGGGVLQDMGVHLIDLIRFVSQQEIQ